jgi:hypothetical protein
MIENSSPCSVLFGKTTLPLWSHFWAGKKSTTAHATSEFGHGTVITGCESELECWQSGPTRSAAKGYVRCNSQKIVAVRNARAQHYIYLRGKR